MNAVEDASVELWHRLLSHKCKNGLQILAGKKLLPLNGTPLETCAHCLAGKQHRDAFHSCYPSRRSQALQLVHADVCMVDARTLGGALYFDTFIDH